MNVEQFRSAHKMKPFKPFLIRTASGESYHVAHPEFAWQSPAGHTIIVSIRGEEVAMIDVEHVTEIVYGSKKPAKGSKSAEN